jgi:hypothetical protein
VLVVDEKAIMKQLLSIFGKKTIVDRRLKRKTCVACGKTNYLERHHITYKPRKTALLCHTDHKRITELNTRMVKEWYSCKRKLSNEDRLLIWKKFLKQVRVERKSQGCGTDKSMHCFLGSKQLGNQHLAALTPLMLG